MRRAFLSMIMVALLVLLASPAAASAITVSNTGKGQGPGAWYEWAAQNTTTYYWRGVKGYFYWKSDGYIPYVSGTSGNTGDHVLNCVSMIDSTGGWAQAGVWRNYNQKPYQYTEWEPSPGTSGIYALHKDTLATDPGAQYVKVKWTGTTDPETGEWYYTAVINSQTDLYEQPNALTMANAQGECCDINNDESVIPATAYFGTNTTGYNGSSYQLNLLNHGDTWENWDTALSYGSTQAYEWVDGTHKVIHYSAGNPYYYFGSWAP